MFNATAIIGILDYRNLRMMHQSRHICSAALQTLSSKAVGKDCKNFYHFVSFKFLIFLPQKVSFLHLHVSHKFWAFSVFIGDAWRSVTVLCSSSSRKVWPSDFFESGTRFGKFLKFLDNYRKQITFGRSFRVSLLEKRGTEKRGRNLLNSARTIGIWM